MMATAFMGYVLPWGQMSFWGATVITNLFSAIPAVGDELVRWLWGGFAVGEPTLIRFFALHFLLPFALVALVLVHILLVHEVGSTNPSTFFRRVDVRGYIPFSFYFFLKDFALFTAVLALFFYFVGLHPNVLGHSDNYIVANPMVTPTHIVPEWYFLPFYAILRSVESKQLGVLLMFGAILLPLLLPLHAKFRYAAGRISPALAALGILGPYPRPGVPSSTAPRSLPLPRATALLRGLGIDVAKSPARLGYVRTVFVLCGVFILLG
jgi:ubiquinol-cytochrome c reductase cytochrome b subunit